MYKRPLLTQSFAAASICACPKPSLALQIYNVLMDCRVHCLSQLATIHQGYMPTACSKAILSAQYSLGADTARMSGNCSNDAPAILLQKL